MRNINIAKGFKSLTKNGKLKIKAASPEIMIVAGVAGVIVSTVKACQASRKLDDILDEHKKHTEEIHQFVDENGFTEEYTEKDMKRDIAVTYKDTIIGITKLYAPSVLLGAASIACIFGSHRIMKNRLLTMSTLYNSTDRAFKEYRKRVAAKLGEEEEKKLRYDVQQQEIEIEEDGKKKKKKIDVIDGSSLADKSPYAKFFDETSVCWERNAEYNLMFLNNQQRIANDNLRAHGFLFLNDVYKQLGLRPTEAGQRVGWIYDEENPVGDNYVDFGIYNIYDERNRAFVNGYEKSILLDFNVDGDIITKAFEEKF